MTLVAWCHGARPWPVGRVVVASPGSPDHRLKQRFRMGSVIKKRRKRMSKKKHRKLLRKTRVQRRKLKK